MSNKQTIIQYIDKYKPQIGEQNAKLLTEYMNKHQATTTEPGYARTYTQVKRLKAIMLMAKKPLNQINEDDLITINTTMKDRKMLSAKDYRTTLKQFIRLIIKPQNKTLYVDLIESDYLRNTTTKREKRRLLVDPNQFWTQQQVNDYIKASKDHSKRQLAWAALWLSIGCRPKEMFNLKKQDIEYIQNKNTLIINVPAIKSKPRTIALYYNEAKAIYEYIQPYLQTLKDQDKLFDISYNAQKKIHKRICKQIKLPEDKPTKFYIARKMVLTKFYRNNDIVKATSMAGHEQGSSSIKHYVGITKDDLIKNEKVSIEKKICPNTNCHYENEAYETNCIKCGAPLNQEQYKALLENQQRDFIQTQLELIKTQIEKDVLERLSKKARV